MRKTIAEKMLGAALLVLVLLMVLVLVAGIGMAAWVLYEGRGPGVERQEVTPVSARASYPKRHYAQGYTGIAPVVVVTRRF